MRLMECFTEKDAKGPRQRESMDVLMIDNVTSIMLDAKQANAAGDRSFEQSTSNNSNVD